MLQSKSIEIERYSESVVPLKWGDFTIAVYRDSSSESETLAIYQGLDKRSTSIEEDTEIFARIHSECLTGEVLGSLKCDCKDQLDMALETIAKERRGVVIYLRQEGRGIGLGNKIRAYQLQNQGRNTIDANLELGFEPDLRDFTLAGAILQDLGVASIRLNTNNPDKIRALRDYGIDVAEVVPSHAPIHEHNRGYLETKRKLLGHQL